MNMRLLTTLALAGASFATVSLAAPMQVTGTIKALDPAEQAITLSDGHVYTLPETEKAAAYTVGDKVTFSWEQEGSVMQVLSISPAS